jgi:hypothetical protein
MLKLLKLLKRFLYITIAFWNLCLVYSSTEDTPLTHQDVEHEHSIHNFSLTEPPHQIQAPLLQHR